MSHSVNGVMPEKKHIDGSSALGLSSEILSSFSISGSKYDLFKSEEGSISYLIRV